MTFELMKLPYAYDALAPHVSKDTLHFHHDKHHQAYVNKLNQLVGGTPLANKGLEDVILAAHKDESKKAVFNNAGQVWNHNLFWNSMTPGGGREPSGNLRARIEQDFGSFEKLKETFVADAVAQFGSGWCWLIEDGGKLAVRATPNAVTPIVDGQRVLLTCDVWEHAYYLDYKNEREKFVKAFIDHLANWDYAASCLDFVAQDAGRKSRAQH
ncbi:MAG TPA: superoxide dismutase [Burkholderiales bacterium]|nr:superoxide dismutase [Burkholderiales bacterium]